jgi:predicted RNA-binding protein with PUA-like domain
MKQYWLVKTEVEDYPFEQFKKDKKIGWTGVRNYLARNFMRDQMKAGDGVLFYHSNADPSMVMGIAEVSKESHPDPTQYDSKSDYYDEKSTKESPRWFMVELKFVEEFKRPVTRDALKDDKRLANMMLFKQGRLSISAVTPEEWNVIVKLGRG